MIRAIASRIADGRELPALQVLTLTHTATLASPARAVRLTAAVDAHPGELGSLRLEQDGRGLFTGRIDRQALRLSAAGRLLTLEARDHGALLLDNEAEPCTLTNLQLTTAFERFAAPYGFLLETALYGGSLGMYTVHKGTTEWEAFLAFCRSVYSLTPFLRRGAVVVDRPRNTAPVTVGAGGLPYTQLTHSFAPYNMLSQVTLRDPNGSYSTAMHNSAAAYYGVRRRRYAIPPSEFTDSPGLDANARIRRSMLRTEEISVTLPGLHLLEPGQAVRIADDLLRHEGLLAEEVVWRMAEDGVTTSLTLVRASYYD